MSIWLGKSAEMHATIGIDCPWRTQFKGNIGCIAFLEEAVCDSTASSKENARAAKACRVRTCGSTSG